MITYDILKKTLTYDPITGQFTRNITTSSRAINGSVVGTRANHACGYIQITIYGRPFLAHRLAFLYMTGSLPKNEIDHINGIKTDNSWKNLREVETSINAQNRHSAQSNSKTGILGVWFDKTKEKWTSQIKVRNRRISLGYFNDLKEAELAYLKAKRLLHAGCTI